MEFVERESSALKAAAAEESGPNLRMQGQVNLSSKLM